MRRLICLLITMRRFICLVITMRRFLEITMRTSSCVIVGIICLLMRDGYLNGLERSVAVAGLQQHLQRPVHPFVFASFVCVFTSVLVYSLLVLFIWWARCQEQYVPEPMLHDAHLADHGILFPERWPDNDMAMWLARERGRDQNNITLGSRCRGRLRPALDAGGSRPPRHQ